MLVGKRKALKPGVGNGLVETHTGSRETWWEKNRLLKETGLNSANSKQHRTEKFKASPWSVRKLERGCKALVALAWIFLVSVFSPCLVSCQLNEGREVGTQPL